MLTLTDADRDAILDALAATEKQPGPTTPSGSAAGHGPVIGIGRALRAAGITPAAIRDRSRRRREHLTYRPSVRLAEIVRARDGHCRFPNCTARASVCDIDHVVPFDHAHPERGGLTVEPNLVCLCRRHHRLKTHGRWKVRHVGGGRLEWTTPSGHTLVTAPEGAHTVWAPEDTDGEVGVGTGTGAVLDDSTAAADAALAAAHGLTLTDSATLAELTDPYRTRGVEADLRYLVDALPKRPAVADSTPQGPRVTEFTDEAPPF